MPFFTPPPQQPQSTATSPTTNSLISAINNLNSKVEYYDDLEQDKLDFLDKVKKGEDKTEIKKCFDLLKDFQKNMDQINSKELYLKAADAVERFDNFCKIFPKELLERYFVPKFNSIYDTLDNKFEEINSQSSQTSSLSGTSTTTSTSGVGVSGYGSSNYSGISIVEYLNSLNKPSDFESRKKLAVEMGMVSNPEEYKGTAEQNTQLLNKLRGSTSTSTSTKSKTGIPSGPTKPIGVSGSKAGTFNPSRKLLAIDSNGNSLYFVRIGPGNYRPAVQADKDAGIQLFARNPNPAARLVYPFIKIQNMTVRRA